MGKSYCRVKREEINVVEVVDVVVLKKVKGNECYCRVKGREGGGKRITAPGDIQER